MVFDSNKGVIQVIERSNKNVHFFQNLNQNIEKIQIGLKLVWTGITMTDILNKSFYTLYLRQLRPQFEGKKGEPVLKNRYRIDGQKSKAQKPFEAKNKGWD